MAILVPISVGVGPLPFRAKACSVVGVYELHLYFSIFIVEPRDQAYCVWRA